MEENIIDLLIELMYGISDDKIDTYESLECSIDQNYGYTEKIDKIKSEILEIK